MFFPHPQFLLCVFSVSVPLFLNLAGMKYGRRENDATRMNNQLNSIGEWFWVAITNCFRASDQDLVVSFFIFILPIILSVTFIFPLSGQAGVAGDFLTLPLRYKAYTLLLVSRLYPAEGSELLALLFDCYRNLPSHVLALSAMEKKAHDQLCFVIF